MQKIFRILIVALFLSYYGGVSLFSHTHSYQWGDVTHSHPYLPSTQHSHTAAGCYLIDNLSLLQFTAGDEIIVFAVAAIFVLIFVERKERVFHFAIPQCSLRAPPVYSLTTV